MPKKRRVLRRKKRKEKVEQEVESEEIQEKANGPVRNQLNKIACYLLEAEKDAEKFDNGVNAPGARVRRYLLDVKNLCHELRREISAEVNERKRQKRAA